MVVEVGLHIARKRHGAKDNKELTHILFMRMCNMVEQGEMQYENKRRN